MPVIIDGTNGITTNNVLTQGNLDVTGTRIFQNTPTGTKFEIGPGVGSGLSSIWGFYAPATYGMGLYTGTNPTIVMSPDGAVLMPRQPAFYVSGTTVVSSPDSIVYTQVLLNRGGHYNTSNGRFTAPIPGVYRFYISSIGSTSTTTTRLYWRRNGARLTYGSITGNQLRLPGGSPSDYKYGSAELIIELNAGDYITIEVGADSSYGDDGSGYNHFAGMLIG